MRQHPSFSFRQEKGVVALVLIVTLALAGNLQGAAAQPPRADGPYETMTLPLEALSWTANTPGGARVSHNPKLDTTMAGLAAAAQESDQAAQAWAESQALRLSGDRVHMQIITTASAMQGAISAVMSVGGEVTGTSNDATLIQGWLPVDSLEAVAADRNVLLIRRPAELVLVEHLESINATTEGLAAMNGPAWHAAGYRGTNVKIGIIDEGFQGYRGLLGADLPVSVTVKNFVDGQTDLQVDGTTVHGTACAEVIHDIAPAATIYFAKIATNLDLQEAVAWLRNTHQVDVISTSLAWYNLTPGDGTGEFADLVQATRDDGILWTTAAGNERITHWGGLYYDPDNTGYHHYNDTQRVNYFGPGDGIAYGIPSGVRVRVFLRWDDWSNVDQDYDLYLLRWNGSSWITIASSENYQNGGAGQQPTEYVTAVTNGNATAYGFVIKRHSSNRAVNFDVFAPAVAPLDEILHERSLINLADAPGAMTVAALDATAPHAQEWYSSQGPTNGPGGAATGGFSKPDIAGFANVSTASYGLRAFFGTSASTPHVAGAAALIFGVYPSFTPDQTQAFLEARAVDMGPAGMDTIFGHGRLFLGAPPSSGATPTPSATPTNTVTSTPTVTATGAPGANSKSHLPIMLAHIAVGTSTPSPTLTSTATRTATPTLTPSPTSTPTAPPGSCPQSGAWSGTTSQGRSITFQVVNSPSCQITAESLQVIVRNSCGWVSTISFMPSLPITSNHFSTGNSGTWISGNFTSSTGANGTFAYQGPPPWYNTCTASGTWSAVP